LTGHCGIPVQQQETCSYRKDSILKLWETPLERRPHDANGDSMSRRICEGITKKLGTSYKCNGRSSKEDEEVV